MSDSNDTTTTKPAKRARTAKAKPTKTLEQTLWDAAL